MAKAWARMAPHTQLDAVDGFTAAVMVIGECHGGAPLRPAALLVLQADTVPEALTRLEPGSDPVAVVVADDLPATPFPEAARLIQAILPNVPLLALTADPAVANVVFLMQAGACDVLVRPLDAAALGLAAARFAAVQRRGDALARREREVFSLLGDGCTTAEIAERLHLKAKTIDGTMIRLRAKLACADTAALRRAAVLHHRRGAVQSAVALAIPLTGHAAIDDQHNGILALLSRLELELEQPETPTQTIQATADALLAQAHLHSACEISLMEETAYPAAQAHRAEHTGLLAELVALRDRLDGARPASLAAFRSFLLHWMGQHITRCDQPLVEHLAGRHSDPAEPHGRACAMRPPGS